MLKVQLNVEPPTQRNLDGPGARAPQRSRFSEPPVTDAGRPVRGRLSSACNCGHGPQRRKTSARTARRRNREYRHLQRRHYCRAPLGPAQCVGAYPTPRRKQQRSRYWFVLQTRGWPNSIPSVNESLISDDGFRKHSLGYQVPRQTGLRFSRKAQIPSWASAAIAFRLITSFV